MTMVKFIDLVVKKELDMKDVPPVFDVREVVWPDGIVPNMIGDAEDARRVESQMQVVKKIYKRLDFFVGGETRHLYVCLEDAIGIDKVLAKIVDARVNVLERKIYDEISGAVLRLKDRVAELDLEHSAMKTKIGFYEGLLVVRWVMYCLKLWKEVIGWSSKLVRRSSTS